MSLDIKDGDLELVEKVSRCLDGFGYRGKIFHTEKTIFTVSDAAAAVGAPASEILKSILLRVNRGESFALALMSGVNRVDTKKIKRLTGASHVSFASPEECTGWSGFKPGGVPPVGYPEQPVTFVDEDLFLYKEVWAAAGSEYAFFPVAPDDLINMTKGTKADIKK